MDMNLLYLHGFNSSPSSHKARVVADWVRRYHPEIRFICPLMPPRPTEAVAAIDSACDALQMDARAWRRTLVVGSSMGGFYATWLAVTHGCAAVLINPAVRPWLGRDYLLGEQVNFHTGERHLFRQQDIDDFADYGVARIDQPERIWVLLHTGDEVLDYRHAEDFYTGCKITVEEGGDHSFQEFERFLPEMIRFGKDA